MKFIFFLSFFSLLVSCQPDSQKAKRKDAADAINLIDSLTNPLGSKANDLVAYFKKINVIAGSNKDQQLQSTQVDSLRLYYDALILSYDQAIENATGNKTIEKFQSLKNNFIMLLNKGKEPWATVIPVQLKMYTDGWNSLTIPEQNIVNTTDSIFSNSASTVLEWAKIVAEQEDSIEKKYHLELFNDRYR